VENTASISNNSKVFSTRNSKSVKSNKPRGSRHGNLSPVPWLSKEVHESQGKPAVHLLLLLRPPNLSWGIYTWQHAASQCTNQLRCNENLYFVEPTQETRPATRTSFHHHPGHVIMPTKESRKARLMVQYSEHCKLVDESEVVVAAMNAYDLVLALPWLKARHREIEWSKSQLTAL